MSSTQNDLTMRRILTTLFVAVFFTTIASAQYDKAKDALGLRANFINYQYPITNDWINDQVTSGAEIEYIRHLNNWFNLALPLKLGKAQLPVDENGNTDDASLLSLDALLQLKFFRESTFIYPYIYGGIGAVNEEFKDFTFAAPVGLGLNFRLAKHTYLSTKAEYRFGFDDLRDNIQIGGGLLLLLGEGEPEVPPVMDGDKDGVPDAQDLCPTVAGSATFNGCPDRDADGTQDKEDECPDVAGSKALKGCPDGDNDGIADKNDQCPTEAGTAENNGCPVRDADKDGVLDAQDDCPNQAGRAATRGCPDRDNDGVADKDDRCPDVAGKASLNGCPDADNDGITDREDRCPNSAGPASNNGCPEVKKEDKERLTFAMKAVQFATGKTTLLPSSFAIMNEIAEILSRYPDYKMRINGHTDSIGEAKPNQTLSERRAKTCYDYLISKGIAADRLSFTGFGETKPIATNKYKAGRDQNRRVEFDIYLPE